MKDVHLLYKERGETPLECIQRFQGVGTLPEGKLTYAGRLDPAAEGLLLVLGGEERFKKEAYLDLPKVYESEILFGVTTDTYDLLGIPTTGKTLSLEAVKNFLSEIEREVTSLSSLPYPPYSSKTIEGKALWTYARANEEIHSLHRKIKIYSFSISSIDSIPCEEILDEVRALISKVKGDFRQDEILKSWEGITRDKSFVSLTCSISCSSGTYIRSVAHFLGNLVGSASLARSIKRAQVGDFKVEDAKRLSRN